MARQPILSEAELVSQVRRHLVYELTWLIYAGHRFQEEPQPAYVAFLDSAAVHARALLEFAEKKTKHRFTLHAPGGKSAPKDAWYQWASNRVLHMTNRDREQAPWPEGREAYERPDKLLRMAGVVVGRLRDGASTIPGGEIRDAYLAVLDAAAANLSDSSEAGHQRLATLYDASEDQPYPV